MLILQHRPSSTIGATIAGFTRSDYSHTSTWYPKAGFGFEAAPFHGVRRVLTFPTGVDAFHVNTDDELAMAFAERQLGKGYDYAAILGFVTFRRRSTREMRKASGVWDCSEFAEVQTEKGGVDILNGDPWEHSPRDLSLSKLLVPVRVSLSGEILGFI